MALIGPQRHLPDRKLASADAFAGGVISRKSRHRAAAYLNRLAKLGTQLNCRCARTQRPPKAKRSAWRTARCQGFWAVLVSTLTRSPWRRVLRSLCLP